MPPPPHEFFRYFVIPAWDRFAAAPADEHAAKDVVKRLDEMTERFWRHYKRRAPDRVFETDSSEAFRNALAQRECKHVALVRDVMEGLHFIELERKTKAVELVVRLQDGSRQSLRTIVHDALMAWGRVLGADFESAARSSILSLVLREANLHPHRSPNGFAVLTSRR